MLFQNCEGAIKGLHIPFPGKHFFFMVIGSSFKKNTYNKLKTNSTAVTGYGKKQTSRRGIKQERT